jgi:uncharacterized protein (DUF1800 family)
MKNLNIIIACFFALSVQAQVYNDYIGAGHAEGITVTTSHTMQGTDARATIDAAGMNADRMEASRFLIQATMGYENADIDEVLDKGFSTWIDDQMAIPPSLTTPEVRGVWQDLQLWRASNNLDTVDVFGPATVDFNYGYWQIQMTEDDLLRQRVAWALSQIFVVSSNSDLGGDSDRLTRYYDILLNGAFGNYRDLIEDISLNVSMGYYLSHLNNPKEDAINNVHPDENYAREIMQLFSIGLYNLNNDGSQILDGNNNPIPTYDNEDIKELAKVFTGLYPGGINRYVTWTSNPYFGLGIWGADLALPMQFDAFQHESSEKVILKNLTIPANQTGMQDLTMALDTLFNHPNVGPFLGRRLIQRLVKSNPTPAYIDRVATVFNDNGQGVRGDLAAVIKAILLDPEARDCAPSQAPEAGRLLEPVVRYIHSMKAVGVWQDQGRYYNNLINYLDDTRQGVLASPTVFNFYTPDHQPVGDLALNDLYGPEYKIHNSSSSIRYNNFMANVMNGVWGRPWYDWVPDGVWHEDYMGTGLDTFIYYPNVISEPELLTEQYIPMVSDIDEFIDDMDVVLMAGRTTDRLRNDIRHVVAEFNALSWMDPELSIFMALWLMTTDPDFNVRN